jgi:hypothetical protein
MKIGTVCIVFCLLYGTVLSQTRVFVSVGSTFFSEYEQNEYYYPKYGNSISSTDGSYSTNAFKQFTFDLEIERKISKFSLVSGLRVFNSGYANNFSTNYSKLTCSHLGIPLLFRINMGNFCYLDMGAMGVYTTSAILEETALRGSVYQVSDKGDIARYLPFRVGFNLQYSLVVNRYFLSAYFIVMRNEVSQEFASDWKVSGPYRNNSLFLRDFNPSYRYVMFGLKVGIRIR